MLVGAKVASVAEALMLQTEANSRSEFKPTYGGIERNLRARRRSRGGSSCSPWKAYPERRLISRVIK